MFGYTITLGGNLATSGANPLTFTTTGTTNVTLPTSGTLVPEVNGTLTNPTINGGTLTNPTITGGTISGATLRYVRRTISGTLTADVATNADTVINWNSTATAAKTETLPACAMSNDGEVFIIKDEAVDIGQLPDHDHPGERDNREDV